MSDSIDRAFFTIDLSRLQRLAPFWLDSFLALRNFPAPGFLGTLDGATSAQAQGNAQNLIQHGIDPLASGAPDAVLYFYVALCIAGRRFKAAVPVSAHLLRQHPQDAALLFLRGMVHFGLRDMVLAWRDFNRSVVLNPRAEHSRLALVYMAGFARDHWHALSHLEPLKPHLATMASWWDVARHIPLIAFQAELFLTGRSNTGGFNTQLLQTHSIEQHRAELEAWLPPYQELLGWPSPPKRSFFVSCDAGYFHRFAIALVLSHIESGSDDGFHLHIVNPDDAVAGVVRRLDLLKPGVLRFTTEQKTFDDSIPPSVYYSAGRFCRMASFFIGGSIDYQMIDADMLINRRLPELQTAPGCVGGFFSCAQDEPMWDYFLAGFVAFRRTDPQAVELISRASQFILKSLQTGQGRWFLDQVALFLAAYKSDIQPTQLDCTHFCDLDHRADSYIWAVTNNKSAPAFEKRRVSLLKNFTTNQDLSHGTQS